MGIVGFEPHTYCHIHYIIYMIVRIPIPVIPIVLDSLIIKKLNIAVRVYFA